MFGSFLPQVVCLIYVICVCFRIVLSNTYCVVFLLCFFVVLCTLCCQLLWIIHFWLSLRYSLTFIWPLPNNCNARRIRQKEIGSRSMSCLGLKRTTDLTPHKLLQWTENTINHIKRLLETGQRMRWGKTSSLVWCRPSV